MIIFAAWIINTDAHVAAGCFFFSLGSSYIHMDNISMNSRILYLGLEKHAFMVTQILLEHESCSFHRIKE